MVNDRPEEGVESLQKSIDRLEKKRETLVELKDMLYELDGNNEVDLHVVNANDSSKIEIYAKSESITPDMEEVVRTDRYLLGEANTPDDISYNVEDGVFNIRKKFYIDS